MIIYDCETNNKKSENFSASSSTRRNLEEHDRYVKSHFLTFDAGFRDSQKEQRILKIAERYSSVYSWCENQLAPKLVARQITWVRKIKIAPVEILRTESYFNDLRICQRKDGKDIVILRTTFLREGKGDFISVTDSILQLGRQIKEILS